MPRAMTFLKVGDRIYMALYQQPLGELLAKYATGRELLVLVGKNTITYNAMLDQSLHVLIEKQRLATDSRSK